MNIKKAFLLRGFFFLSWRNFHSTYNIVNNNKIGLGLSDIHVIVVDDQEDLANILTEALEMEGFKVSEFHSAVDALEKIDGIDFDVIISDAHMPGMGGLEFFQRVKEKFKKPHLFYLCTGDMDITSSDFEAQGGTKVISKPYNIFDLCDELSERAKKE